MVPGHVSEKALSGNLRCHDGDSNENAATFLAEFFAVNAQLRREITQLHVLSRTLTNNEELEHFS